MAGPQWAVPFGEVMAVAGAGHHWLESLQLRLAHSLLFMPWFRSVISQLPVLFPASMLPSLLWTLPLEPEAETNS